MGLNIEHILCNQVKDNSSLKMLESSNRHYGRELKNVNSYLSLLCRKYLRKVKFKNPLNLREICDNLQHIKGSEELTVIGEQSRYDECLDYTIKAGTNIKQLMEYILDPIYSHKELYLEGALKKQLNNIQEEKVMQTINYINSWLTCAINQLYLEFCQASNTISKGRISIPEHLVHEIFFSNSEQEILMKISTVVNGYIGKDKKVYPNCYLKYIQNNVKTSDFKKDNQEKFSNFLTVYKEPFKTNVLKIEGQYFEAVRTLANIVVAERFVSNYVPKKYKENIDANIIIDRKFCENKGIMACYISSRNVNILHPDVRACHVTHELTHEWIDKLRLGRIVSDFLFENTRGSNIVRFDKTNSKGYKYKEGLNFLIPYAAKVNQNFEAYSKNNELLSVALQYLSDIKVPLSRRLARIKLQSNTMHKEKQYALLQEIDSQIDIQVRERLDIMYKEFPELAHLVLAFLNGKL